MKDNNKQNFTLCLFYYQNCIKDISSKHKCEKASLYNSYFDIWWGIKVKVIF